MTASNGQTPMYELEGVSKRFTKGSQQITALHDVNLEIREGSFIAVQGPTGHGKTTLLQLLGGMDRPTSGSIRFRGEDLSGLGEASLASLRARAFGFIFQTFNLIPTLSAQENVETALVPSHLRSDERRSRAAEALRSVDLADRASHLPGELSGGQQQRVAIARALVKEPSVILADEPTGNLDEGMRDDVIGLLEDLWKQKSLTLLIVTHDTSIATRAQTRLVMRDGTITQPAAPGR